MRWSLANIWLCNLRSLVAYYVIKCKWRFKLGSGTKWKCYREGTQVRFRRRGVLSLRGNFRDSERPAKSVSSYIRTRQLSRFRRVQLPGSKSKAPPLMLHWVVAAIELIAKRNYPELIEINRLIITSRTKLVCFSIYLLADFGQAKCR